MIKFLLNPSIGFFACFQKQCLLLFFIFFTFFSSFESDAQNVSFDNTPPVEMSVCGDSEIFYIEFTNSSGGDLTNVNIVVDFPTGIEYVASTINETTSFNIQESNISDLSSVIFSMNTFTTAATATFNIETSAVFEAYNQQNSGATFSNTVTVNYDGGSDDDESDTYNILYPALSITSVSPMAATVTGGSNYSRTVTIVNGGYGALSSFVLQDIYNSNLDLLASDLGVLNGSRDQITFSSSDFTGIGDGDEYFERNESLVVTETISAIGCTSAQSELIAIWGCDGSTTSSNIKNPFTTIESKNPSLSYSANPSFNTCVDGSGDNQSLTITNNGSGAAVDLVVEIFPSHETQYTESLLSSIEYTLNGTTTSLTPSETNAATGYDCFQSNPIDGFTVSLPNIQPGESISLDWINNTCATTYCGDVRYLGWEYETSYNNACGTYSRENEGVGQVERRKNFASLYEAPTDLVDGEVGKYSLILGSATFNLPSGTDPYFEVSFNIPEGLKWLGDNSDLTYSSGVTQWTADEIYYNTITRELVGQFQLPLPSGFSLTGSEFDLNLTAECLGASNNATLGMQLFYFMDTNCASPYEIPMTCKDVPITKIHCPGVCSEGLAFRSFEVERISLGQSDNDSDGLADATNSIDTDKVKLNRMMVSDTFKTTFEGIVNTSGSFPSWSYGYATSALPYGSELDYLSAKVTVYDNSTGQTLVCDNIPFTENTSGDVLTVNFDFSPAQLNAIGCSSFSGFVLEQDDSVKIEANYKVVGNIGGASDLAIINNSFYVSDTQNGTPYQCDDWSGNFTLIGYYYTVNYSEQYNIKNCTRTIRQDYRLSIGPCCSNYNGGNMFPYEFRNWANIKDLRVTIPEGYIFESGYFEQWRTKSTATSVKETVSSITPNSTSATELTFDLEQHHVSNGGTLNYSDDGFTGRVYLTLSPTCNVVNEAGNFPMKWYFDFRENYVLGGNITSEYSGTADYLKYYRGDLDITSVLPTQDGTGETVTWDVEIECSTGNVTNGFFYIENDAGDVVITEVKDVTNNTILTPVNGMYQVGDFSIGDEKDYQITASYNSCSTPEVKVTTGFHCDGYPASSGAYECSTQELMLYINPEPAELQVRFDGAINGVDDCANLVEFEIEMLSSKLGAIYDLQVDIQIPSTLSMLFESGSTQVLYPESGSYSTISDPTLSGDTYTITGAQMDAAIGSDGLVGVTDVTANLVKLKFNVTLENNFKPGDFLNVTVSGREACGAPISGLNLVYDPNAIFKEPSGIGLDDVSDDWAMAWGDYDGDGNVDLFVSDYDDTKPNKLYKNDGDGTFTKVTSGDIVTDLATSIGATWGDYDNDGDLDLFVSNHIGYQNFLYRNNGDGTFTKILNDPIVSDSDYGLGASWADYDNDGYLDMFVSNYFSTKYNQLYYSNGDGTFTKDNSAAPTLEAAFTISGVWGDYNNDGLPDLFIANSYDSNNSLYRNLGNRSFEKVTTGPVVTDGGTSTGGSWGDYDNDGDLDLFVSNGGNQPNFLYQNNGDETFTKITSGDIVTDEGQSQGSAWGDYDNDGDLDLFVSNDQGQNNYLYANNGDGTFTKITNAISQAGGLSFGAGWADIDNDGDLDLYVANHDENENFIYTNTRGRCQSNVCVVLEGTNSNGSAIGAKIYVKANIYGQDVWQMREVSAQSGGGVGGQSELKQIFGLGDASVIDSIKIEWPSGMVQSIANQSLGSCLTITETEGSEVCGIAYYDENGNCVKDSSELVIPNQEIIIEPGNRTVTTDENGSYSIFLNPNDYTITQGASTVWNESCTTDYNVTVVGNTNTYCGNDFANTAVNQVPDLEVTITASPQRIGFENLVAINYTNIGTQPATNTILTLTLESGIDPVESSIPWTSINGNDVIWELGTVEVGETVTIFFTDFVTNSANVGDIVSFPVTIESNETEVIQANNNDLDMQPLVGGFDPNDILVYPEGYIDNDQELTYTIRFQNVGNIPASNIVVENQLPENLDIDQLQMGIASHNYRLEIGENRRLIWTFDNINLPDSVNNEAQSHGFIIYKIKPIQGLEAGDIVHNNAEIYFDNNLPIYTNIVYNTIGDEPETTFAEDGKLQIYPNPTFGQVTFEISSFTNEEVKIKSLFIQDLAGKIILSKESVLDDKITVDEGVLTPGYYEIVVRGDDRQIYRGRLIVQ